MLVPQLLCFENDPSFTGGVYAGRVPPSSKFVQFKSARVSACLRSIPFLFTSLRTLLRFFALRKSATLFLSASALFAKKHAGVEVPLEVPPPSAGNAERMDRAGQARPSVRIENYDLIWLEAGSQVTAAWRK